MKGDKEMKFNKIAKNLLSLAVAVSAAAVMGMAVSAADAFTHPDYIGDLTKVYANEEEKFATMGVPTQVLKEDGTYETVLVADFENEDYEIRALDATGEVGIRVKETGQILLTNPYDVPSMTNASEEVKQKLMSQIVLQYKDGSGALGTLSSYADAACNGEFVYGKGSVNQIEVKRTRNGIRVEYTIGKEQAKYVVPKQIEKSRFEENIIGQWKDTSVREYKQMFAYYVLKDANAPGISTKEKNSMQVQFPITEKYAIYVLDPGISNRELEVLQDAILSNTTYTEDDMLADYELIDYVDTSAAPALFRFAIEYTVDEHGIQITLPANSIKYDSSNYSLENVQFLPYFCAGNHDQDGFTLLPDGSGTVTNFKDVSDREFILTGKLYGKDYSFHSITGYTQETMRIPAFGALKTSAVVDVEKFSLASVRNANAYKDTDGDGVADWEDDDMDGDEIPNELDDDMDGNGIVDAEDEIDRDKNGVPDFQDDADGDGIWDYMDLDADGNGIPDLEETGKEEYNTHGYVAYFTEGDALAEFSSSHGGTTHKYNSVYATFYPQTTDKYSLTGISATGDATWTVKSNRKYTGNYTMRVFPISGEGKDYTDMAKEVRDFLVDTGVLTKMTPENDKSEDIALYIENFGTIKTPEKILGFPVERQSTLTTFDQTKGMIDDLKKGGIDNINVRLTGWYNGGMEHTAPAKLSVPKEIGGKKGLQDLISYAGQNGVTIYPDVDFSYVGEFKNFDGISVKNDTAKTLDGRSAAHRIYNALYQGFESDEKALISVAVICDMYEDMYKDYKEFGTKAISLGLIGQDLNSDHNDDYPLNRDDARILVQNFLSEVSKDNESIMVSGGNAYTLEYVDHIINVPLDSSMNINTSYSVPFMGMVLHGYTEFAGTAINLDGDYDYSVLKAIENGANLYYIVSKDNNNTSKLKAFPEFSKYYAVRYDNWQSDIIGTYNKLNEAMKKVKYSTISEHEYIATRVVRVKYDNGTEFLLNYNTHSVTLDDYLDDNGEPVTIESMDFRYFQR